MAYTTINKSSLNMNTKLYTGNGSENHTISGVGFQSDLTWLKSRSSAIAHMWTDAVRGNNKVINSNLGNAETTFSSLKSWNSDGFVLSNNTNFNGNNVTFASWNWKAGTSFSNSAGANGASLASTGSINTAAGFSIISYNGRDATDTIAHGLGAEPSVILFKCRSNAGSDWYSYWKPLGNNSTIRLNNTGGSGTTGLWNNTNPTSSVFTVISSDVINRVNRTFVAYCFAEKQGYSKFGKYTGNGNADGTFIYTGFKPAFFMAKRTNASGDPWVLIDNKRNTFNALSNTLTPNDSNAENTGTDRADFLSNGIKIKTTSDAWNGNGSTYIYMAFGQSIVGSNNVPATAR